MACSGFEKYKASLCVGIFPIILKNWTADNFSIRFELYDYATKNIFQNATYDISIIKNEYDTKLKDLTILSGTLNTRNGFFTVYINSSANQGLEQSKKELVIPKLDRPIRADSTNLTLPFKLKSGQYKVLSVAYVQNRQLLL